MSAAFKKIGHGALELLASPFRAVGEPLRSVGQFGDDFADLMDQRQNGQAQPESAGGRKRRSIRKHMKSHSRKHMKSHSRKHMKAEKDVKAEKSHSRKRSAKKSAKKSTKKSNPKSRKSCSIRKMRWVQKSEDDKKAHCRKKHNRK